MPEREESKIGRRDFLTGAGAAAVGAGSFFLWGRYLSLREQERPAVWKDTNIVVGKNYTLNVGKDDFSKDIGVIRLHLLTQNGKGHLAIVPEVDSKKTDVPMASVDNLENYTSLQSYSEPFTPQKMQSSESDEDEVKLFVAKQALVTVSPHLKYENHTVSVVPIPEKQGDFVLVWGERFAQINGEPSDIFYLRRRIKFIHLPRPRRTRREADV